MMTDNPQVQFELFRYQLLPASQHAQLDLYHEINSTKELKERKNEFFQEILIDFLASPRLLVQSYC